jgi:DNA invertase Pin-like site-specific DNA recombinase
VTAYRSWKKKSAVAQLERDLIRERVTAGIRNAQANGKKLGRPTSTVDRQRIMELKAGVIAREK